MKEVEEVEILEEYTPTELSEKLNINPSTLRKYSGMIDEQNGEPFFKRDNKNGRKYDKEAADILERVISLKKSPDINLESSIDLVLNEYKQENQALGTQHDIAEKTPKTDEIKMLHNKIDFIGNQIQKLIEQNDQLIKDNQEMKLALAQPEEEPFSDSELIEEKQTFFTRLFKKK